MIIFLHFLFLSARNVFQKIFIVQKGHHSTQTSEEEFQNVLRILSEFRQKKKRRESASSTTVIMYNDFYDSDSEDDFVVTSTGPLSSQKDESVAMPLAEPVLAAAPRNINEGGGAGFKGFQQVQRQTLGQHLAGKATKFNPIGRGRCKQFEQFSQSNTSSIKTMGSSQPGSASEQDDLTQINQPCTSGKPDSQSDDLSSQKTSVSTSSGYDVTVDWDAQESSEPYIVKPKTVKQFSPRVKSFQSIKQANPDISSKWLASMLANRPVQQSESEMHSVLEQLELMLSDDRIKDKSHINKYLGEQFNVSVNSHALVAYLLKNLKDTHVAKTSTLAFLVMKEFDKWVKANKSWMALEKYLTKDMQLDVYTLCTSHHLVMFEMAVRCFHLCYPGNDDFLQNIQVFLGKKKYKEVAVCAGKLGLQHHFSMEEVVLPLILQDKWNLLETFVYGCPEQQQQLVQYLDHLCDKETSLELILSSMKQVPSIKREKFQKKVLSKLAVRLMKLYQIPQDLCPNISSARGLGALKYLMHKRFIEKTLSTGSWEDMIQAAVGANVYLQEQLVVQLDLYNEPGEALTWATRFQLPDHALPTSVIQARAQLQSQSQSSVPGPSSVSTGGDEEDWDSACFTEEEINAAFYQLNVPVDQVMVVDTLEAYNRCMDHVTQPGTIIGIDSEWKPAFCGQTQKVALMQLAVQDTVYLLDILALEKQFTDRMWQQFAQALFCSKDTIKLGYGIESDLKMLVRTFPSIKEPMMCTKRVVNLEVLARKYVLADMTTIVFDEDEDNDKILRKPDSDDEDEKETLTFSASEEKGLSELVKKCFGKPLNKSEQMSNWERRPLRPEQICYAALDAYVLLEVYQVLIRLAQSKDPQADLEPSISTKWLKPSKNEKRRARQRGDKKQPRRLPERPAPRVPGPPRSPQQLRVVVDTMLQGLGKQLRSCGVDVVIPEAFVDHDHVVQISLKESRIVLTSGMPYQMIVANVGPDMCYNVVSDKSRTQVTEVLDHFNIRVQQQDIFSRCQVCNGDVYLTVPSDAMAQLYDQKRRLQSFTTPHSNSSSSQTSESSSEHTSSGPELVAKFQDLGIDWCSARVSGSNVEIQIELVHQSMFSKVDLFYCCARCGKVFWEGSHFDRVCEQYQHVLNLNPNSPSVYDNLQH